MSMIRKSLLVLTLFFMVAATTLSAQTDTRFIPDSAVGAIVMFPKDATSQESMALFPHEIVTAFGEQQFGVNPMKITEVILLVDKPDFESEPEWGGIIRFDEVSILGGEFVEYTEPDEFKGYKAYVEGPVFGIVEIDRKTLLVGSLGMLAKMIDTKSSDSRLARMITGDVSRDSVSMFFDVEPMRDQLNQMIAGIEEIPPQFEKFKEIPNLIDTIQLTQQLNLEFKSQLVMTATEGKAQTLADTLLSGLQMGKEMIFSEMSNQMDMSDPVQKATLKYLYRLGDHIESQLTPAVTDNQLVYEASQGIAAIPVLTALLLPAVQQVRVAARRTDSMNRLRQLMIAMHNYHDSYKGLPTNITDDDGNALLSWRVQLLPYLEANHLYEQFHLDEPWDSEHNIQLVEQMPEFLECPGMELESGSTLYLALAGKNTFFDGRGRKSLELIMDGTSRTIGLVEGNQDSAVIWTKPEDLNVDLDDPLRGIGGVWPDGFNAAFFDGSVRFIMDSLDLRTLRQLIQPNDGEVPFDH